MAFSLLGRPLKGQQAFPSADSPERVPLRAGRVARNLLGRMRRSPRVDQGDGEGDPAVHGALPLPGGGGGRIAGAFRRGRAAARPEGVRPESGSGSISSHETEDPLPALPLRGGPSRSRE